VKRAATLLAVSFAVACDCQGAARDDEAEAPPATSAPETSDPADFTGRYRAVLASPGGALPFFLTIHPPGTEPRAEAHNGEEDVPFTAVAIDGSEIRLEIADYGAVIEATRDDAGALRGRWRRNNREGQSELPFTATKIEEGAPRFADPPEEPGAESIEDVSGAYRMTFTDDDGDYPARGELEQDGSEVRGTILTATGDFRYLEGDFSRGVLRLSTFNGSFAFLFVARATAEGGLSGDYWSRDTYHAAFEATPIEEDEEVLPDPYGETRVVSEDQKLRFEVESIEGERLALPSEALGGQVVILDVFGTWCPNCMDEAPLLSRLYERYHDRGLTVIGLAFEHRSDPEVALPRLESYRERHEIPFPLVLAGRSVGSDVSAVLPDLSELRSYPTTIFIGRDGRVRRVHSGFAGPATGEHHRRLVAEFEELVETLISEARPPAGGF
jgi:thiol-disulfide isomerase/thioredoxin